MRRPAVFPAWGWTSPARALLVALAVGGSVSILVLSSAGERPTVPTPRLVVDLNASPPEVLESLPRLGPVLVGRIVAAREQKSFRSVDELDARVKGIGPVTVRAVRPYLRVGRAP